LTSLFALALTAAAAYERPPLVYGRLQGQRPAVERQVVPGEALRDAVASEKQLEAAIEEPAADEPSIPVAHAGRAGWVRTAASLLLYNADGDLLDEIGLGSWTEPGPEGTQLRRTVRGGISKDGRFAWSWEKAESLKEGRGEKPVTTSRLMRYLGTQGQELFRNELADAPQGLEPVAVSDNGERVLLAERAPGAWIMAAFDFAGNRLVDARAKGHVELAQMSGNGSFALIRWHQLDQPPEYTLLRIADRKTVGLPPITQAGASPKLTNDGRVLVGGKVVFPKQ
jgi:hypothetical protein